MPGVRSAAKELVWRGSAREDFIKERFGRMDSLSCR